MKKAIRTLTLTLAGALLFTPFAQGAVSTAQKKDGLTSLEKSVRHELVMLPWFGVFDNLEFQVNGNEVVLLGHVTRPTLKNDAARVVSRLEGVTKVVNNIEVLPLSSFDDQIRLATYQSDLRLRRTVPLQLGTGAADPHRREERQCDLGWHRREETDRNIAALRANVVAGVFSVDSDLKVEGCS
jgi:hyperosmotically inducible periplasmic protein